MLEGKKTYIGLLVAFVPTIAGFLGYSIGPEAASELGGILAVAVDSIEELITTAGVLFAWYGRKVTKG